ncbi:MAG: lipid A biosynthesis protein [Actinobacteria bacterium]|nr:lipid A biosynthesis protein [Actinomycetota bacterium]
MIDWLVKLFTDFGQLPAWEKLWLVVGFTGQLLFMARFIVQWIVSERHKRSVIPIAFWYLSLFGSLTLLGYALHKRDPVFILGLSLNSLIYIRNLWLIYRPGPDASAG